MARVVKKVKKTKEQRQKRNRLIMASIFGLAVVITGIILLISFLNRPQPAVDVFSGEEFAEFQINHFDDLTNHLENHAEQYVFVFVYNSESFDPTEVEEHLAIYNNLRYFVRDLNNARAGVEVSFLMINLSRGNGITIPSGSVLGTTGNLAFIALQATPDATEDFVRTDTLYVGEEYFEVTSTNQNGMANAIGQAIGFLDRRNQ